MEAILSQAQSVEITKKAQTGNCWSDSSMSPQPLKDLEIWKISKFNF